jgi:hypothetical protein
MYQLGLSSKLVFDVSKTALRSLLTLFSYVIMNQCTFSWITNNFSQIFVFVFYHFCNALNVMANLVLYRLLDILLIFHSMGIFCWPTSLTILNLQILPFPSRFCILSVLPWELIYVFPLPTSVVLYCCTVFLY